MKTTLPALRLALIGLAVASAFGASSVNAQTPAQTPAQAGAPSDSARPRGPGAGGPQLFTKEELDAIQWDSLAEEMSRSVEYDIVPDYDKLLDIMTAAKREASGG